MRIKIVLLSIFLIIWLALIGLPNEVNTILYAFIAPLLTYFICSKLSLIPKNIVFTRGFFSYFLWLLKEIYVSSVTVIQIAWRTPLAIKPTIAPIKSIQTQDEAITLYANSITLTPGTITLNVIDNVLLVHALDVSMMEGLEEGTMDRNIKKIVKNK